MNSLQLYITQNALDPIVAMNDLQNHNVISDNCIDASEVASADCFRACMFLETMKEVSTK